jgi:hypothetical protein
MTDSFGFGTPPNGSGEGGGGSPPPPCNLPSGSFGTSNYPPTVPNGSNASANSIAEGRVVNTTAGLTASATDPEGEPVTYSLSSDSSGGGFKIDFETAAVRAYAFSIAANRASTAAFH